VAVQLVVDANILVAELFRKRGRELVASPDLELFVAEKVWGEARHELTRRTSLMLEQNRLSEIVAKELLVSALETAETHVEVVAPESYQAFEKEALQRLPRDPDDWHTVALALALDADIWTQDGDFLGCGVAIWTTETLRLRLGVN
jgi:predicted nucleic acid-binding protein